jgi:hypothetical protein
MTNAFRKQQFVLNLSSDTYLLLRYVLLKVKCELLSFVFTTVLKQTISTWQAVNTSMTMVFKFQPQPWAEEF